MARFCKQAALSTTSELQLAPATTSAPHGRAVTGSSLQSACSSWPLWRSKIATNDWIWPKAAGLLWRVPAVEADEPLTKRATSAVSEGAVVVSKVWKSLNGPKRAGSRRPAAGAAEHRASS